VKTSYAGFDWDDAAFDQKVRRAGEQLRVLAHPARRLQPGRYRVFLTPTATSALVGMLGWGGFGLKSQRTRTTPLLRMLTGEARLDERVSMAEDTAHGAAAPFQDAGFLRPDRVPLIERGELTGALVSPRSAREYGVETNGAAGHEGPESLDISAGSLALEDALAALGTGIWIGNLWYLNFSDRSACRTTGMTRFGTFWVEGGSVQAPLDVMRFDETLYRVLGDNLQALTREREWLLSASTYGWRSTRSSRLPGALVEDFTLTL
jgi:predicted Zn-dependent protease